jgi:Rps23 Pro-64 3,4-dihydroxylase Tpa1-like proline 4-hydroxylase
MTTIQDSFSPLLLSERKRNDHKEAYSQSKPYRHAVVDGLINDELLQRARQEILDELRFTEKETDIYKVNQTGDLINLDGLPEAEAKRLENVLLVRNAIYSLEFRQWLQDVTGCGPLSSKKKDMSINDYTSGCHLLNHE